MKKIITLSLWMWMMSATAMAGNLTPVSSFTVSSPARVYFYSGESVTFDGSGSYDRDEGGSSITYYQWYVGGVLKAQGASTSSYTTSFSVASGQTTVSVKLRVRDDENTWAERTINYTVKAKPGKVYYIKDHLGSIRTSVDEQGNTVGYDDYYPFGLVMPNRSNNSANDTDNYKFTGHERDTEASLTLDYMMARNYDPISSRFLSIDPYAVEYPSLSPYTYVANNPINAIDPDGKRIFFVGGANNDQDGWNYINRWGRAFTNAGIQGFTRINASGGKIGDIAFTSMYRHSRYETYSRGVNTDNYIAGLNPAPYHGAQPVQHKQISSALNQVRSSLADSPLAEGEQLNLAGYSYGSVLQAHVALNLAESGTKIDNLILIGSPISTDSDLFNSLNTHKNIENVIRFDISGDLLSNPSNLQYLKGAFQNSGDDGAHFDLARPGKDVDQLIIQVVEWLKQQGVK